MNETLQIKTDRFKTLAVVQLSGMLARLEIYKLKSHLDQLFEEGKKYLILDMAHVEHIDSAGVGILVRVRAQCQKAGGHLNLVAPTSVHASQVIAVANLKNVVPVFESLRAAQGEMAEKYGLSMPSETDDGSLQIDSGAALRQVLERIRIIEERLDRIEKRLTFH
jgi:anti-anti-sigma factor